MLNVCISNETGSVVTTRISTEDGQELQGIARIEMVFAPGEPVKAQMELLPLRTRAKAEAEFFIAHPATGERRRVRKIEFDDGETFDF